MSRCVWHLTIWFIPQRFCLVLTFVEMSCVFLQDVTHWNKHTHTHTHSHTHTHTHSHTHTHTHTHTHSHTHTSSSSCFNFSPFLKSPFLLFLLWCRSSSSNLLALFHSLWYILHLFSSPLFFTSLVYLSLFSGIIALYCLHIFSLSLSPFLLSPLPSPRCSSWPSFVGPPLFPLNITPSKTLRSLSFCLPPHLRDVTFILHLSCLCRSFWDVSW